MRSRSTVSRRRASREDSGPDTASRTPHTRRRTPRTGSPLALPRTPGNETGFPAGEENHDPESREREGDPRGLEAAETFMEQGRGKDRDERRCRGNDERGRPRSHRSSRFSQVQEEMIAGEAGEREEGQMRYIMSCREWTKSAAHCQITNEQDVREGEPQERKRDPRHVDQRLFDRNEGEPPEEDEEHQRSVNGTIVTEPVLGGRHVRGRFTSNKKLRASIAGAERGLPRSDSVGRG